MRPEFKRPKRSIKDSKSHELRFFIQRWVALQNGFCFLAPSFGGEGFPVSDSIATWEENPQYKTVKFIWKVLVLQPNPTPPPLGEW